VNKGMMIQFKSMNNLMLMAEYYKNAANLDLFIGKFPLIIVVYFVLKVGLIQVFCAKNLKGF